ncbi:MAG: RNA polymerase sigma factor [Pirellulaceae bacterium]|nr:RNA polymerase sigma factor [Pirellulaceae bacterium]
MHEPQSSNKADGMQDAPSNLDLKTWVVEASCGNRMYQRQIYDYLAPRIYRVIRRIVGSSEADDVMQDFVIQLFSKLKQFRFESSLETWSHRMAVNESLQHLRKKHREEERKRKFADHAGLATPHTALAVQDEAELLHAAMGRISGEQRALLHMKEVEGMGYQAIASILGIPEGTVGSRLNKARNDLRSSLIGLGWEV